MTRSEQAEAYFLEGYNCAQATALAFADLFPFDRDTLTSMVSSFGGGMGRLREVCGAVSAVFMTAGLLYGYNDPKVSEEKTAHYERIQELAHSFEARFGTILCRDLLALEIKHDDPVPEKRTAHYYETRPCPDIVKTAAQILDDYIQTHPVG